MSTKPQQSGVANRRRFLGCAASALAVGAAPIWEEPEEVIPLKAVFASSGQEGMLEVPRNRFVEGENGLKRNLYRAAEIGPSNLFLVRGDEIDEVLEATWYALAQGFRLDRSVDSPARRKAPSKQLWAFVYFGAAQGGPPEWTVTRVAVQRDRVRVTATRPDRAARLGIDCDEIVYMFWIPLGEPKQKAYTLQAYDETNRATIMTRYVVV